MLVIICSNIHGNYSYFMNKICITAAVCLITSPLWAQAVRSVDYSGHYSNNSRQAPREADLEHIRANRYRVSLTTSAPVDYNPSGSCAGAISGEMAITAHTGNLRVRNESFIEDEAESRWNQQYCHIKLEFLAPNTIEIIESGGCSDYHGAACDFNGVVIHDANGI